VILDLLSHNVVEIIFRMDPNIAGYATGLPIKIEWR